MRNKLMAACAAVAFATAPAAAAEFVTNGGFEAGNTGFTSTYAYVAPGGSMVPEGTYSVGTNAANYHPSWASVPAFQGSNYLIANGSPSSDASVWSQALTGLVVGRTYNFSAYATNVCCNTSYSGTNVTPIIIGTSDGTRITTQAEGTVGTTGQWRQITGSFTATSASTTLSLFTDTSAASGNDFGIDAISVQGAIPEPATWAMLIAGFGMVGAAVRRRKSNLAFA